MNRILCTVVSSFFIISASHADTAIDADVVNLRINCVEGAGTVNENKVGNCFQTTIDLDNWIVNTRTSTNPLLVNIGPGTFGQISCAYSDVTFRGSGRENSIIQWTGPAFSTLTGCDNLNVEDLKIESTGLHGVLITNTQELDSTWTNVEISGVGYGWLESIRSCNGPERGTHRIFSSRITSSSSLTTFKTARAYGANCSKSWLYNSEVNAIANDLLEDTFILDAVNDSEIHVYGSNLRLLVSPDLTLHKRMAMIASQDNSEIHIHGTGIDLISENAHTVYVLNAQAGSSIHANGSAYALKNPGTTIRIFGEGTVKAPYLWEQGKTAPDISSVTGADIFVDTSGAVPEMFIYSAACNGAGGTWVSSKTGLCR